MKLKTYYDYLNDWNKIVSEASASADEQHPTNIVKEHAWITMRWLTDIGCEDIFNSTTKKRFEQIIQQYDSHNQKLFSIALEETMKMFNQAK